MVQGIKSVFPRLIFAAVKKRCSPLLLLLLAAMVCGMLPRVAMGQITGQGVDTTFNSITRDTTGKKGPVAGTWQTVNSDSTRHHNAIPDTIKVGKRQPNPKKAGLFSAIVPGLGQVYNRQYWKVPVIYTGLGVAAYFISNNLDKYQSYRKAYINRLNNPGYKDQYTGIYDDPAQLQHLQNEYNKYLDLAVLLTGIGYALQIMDAVTSAHLKNFDISRDISFHMQPVVVPNGIGIGVVMHF